MVSGVRKILPTDDLTFREMRSGNCYYVDKTKYIHELFTTPGHKHCLLTRPRRFGKTLLVSTW